MNPEPSSAGRSVAIVGRPNVGKSALFNRLASRKIAIVHDMPGVTRDRIAADCRLGNAPFSVVDTGGIGAVADADFAAQVETEVQIAIESASAIIFVVDAQQGLTPVDADLARRLRRSQKPVVLAVNKVDRDTHAPLADDFAKLGFPRAHTVSAEHGRGIGDLVETVEALLPPPPEASGDAPPPPINIAMIGRPNVGKSSLINAILGDRRTIVSEISGTTRDAVDVPWERAGQPYVFVDTAGIRARGKVSGSVEVFSVMRSEKSIERADLCVMVIDASMGVTSMDRKIAGKIAAAHKPCVIAMNKWDLVEEGDDDVTAKLEEIRAELFFLDYAPAVLLSAKTGEHVARLFKAIDKVRRASKARIGTGPLNRLLGAAITATPPPSRSGRRFKILYGTQLEPGAVAAVPPPQFLLFVNDAGLLPDNYRKHLEHKIRDVEPFPGLPLLLRFRGRPPRDGRGKR